MSWKDRAQPIAMAKDEVPAWKKRAVAIAEPQETQQEIQQADSSSTLKDVARAGTGFAVGAAEAVNPLAGPRNLEVLVRAPFQGFKKAEESAVLPSADVGDIAAGIRTGARLIPEVVRPSTFFDMAKKIYSEERKSQSDFEKNFLPAGSKTAGELTSGAVSLASLAKGLGQALNLGKKAAASAKVKSFESLKPLGKTADRIVEQGRVADIGEQLLKDKVVTAGASFKDIQSRVGKKLEEYGEKIGYFVKTADDAVARDSSLRGISVDELADQINNRVVAKLNQDPSTRKIAANVSDWLEDLKIVTSGQDLSFQQAQNFKKSLDGMKAKFSVGGDSLSKDAFQDVYRVLNETIENGVDRALAKAAPQLNNEFKASKNAYRNLLDAEDLIEKTISRTSKNRALSLTDYIAGSGGLIAGAGSGIGTAGALGLAGAITNKIARTRGNQISAATLNAISKAIGEKAPGLIKYEGVLQTAAKKGAEALAGTHLLLRALEPQYDEISRDVEKSAPRPSFFNSIQRENP